MKRFLSFLAVAIMAIVTFTSCSNNDEPNGDNFLIGKWKQTWDSGKVSDNGYSILDIRADHSFTWYDYEQDGYCCEEVDGTWSYSSEHSVITFVYEFDPEDGYAIVDKGVIEKDGKTMWYYDEDDVTPEQFPYIKQ